MGSLAENQENRFAIQQAGALGLFIRQPESQHAPVVEKAVGVIWNLAHEEIVQHQVRQLNGLKPLIDLLTSESPLIRFNAAGAFPLLTELETNAKEVVELGAIKPLIEILKNDSNLLLLQNAAQTLGNLSQGQPENQNLIREAEGLTELQRILDTWSSAEASSGADGQTSSRPQVDDDGSRSNIQELLAKCCYAIWLLCEQNNVSQDVFRQSQGLSTLAKLLNPSNDDMTLEMVAGSICALCEGNDENKRGFRSCQGIQPLIELLEHGHQTVQLHAAKALCHLAENNENRNLIRNHGGLDKLVKLLAK